MVRLISLIFGLAVALVPASARAQPGTACAYLAGLVPESGGPLFVPSYPAAGPGPLRGVAFLYDNATAAIALVGCGQPRRAARIGDAILAALDHDRFWHDGRLRNAYAAGSITEFPVRLGGWWDAAQNRWLEDGYQVSSDSGNAAWAILALMAIDRGGQDHRYRDGALRIGAWVAERADSRGPGGYGGGFSGWEPNPVAVLWKSTEHNTDLAAAFTLLFTATGDPVWRERAKRAADFVAAVWDEGCRCFATGIIEDGVTHSPLLALDAELWPLMAVPGMNTSHGPAVLNTVNDRLRADGGYSYTDAALGLWTEGTAQAALLAKLQGRDADAVALTVAVNTERAPDGGFFAIKAPSLDTGFGDATDPKRQRYYYRLVHLAPAAWAALAERGFNPFTDTGVLP
jgi:hypothetical protein